MEVTKQYRTETGHRLINYSGKCGHIHGHSYLWEWTVEGPVPADGIVVDFKILKDIMEIVIGPLDHALVLHEQDPVLVASEYFGPVGLLDTPPDVPRVIRLDCSPTVENLALFVSTKLKYELADQIKHFDGVPLELKSVRLKVWETVNSYATIEE